MTGSFLSLLLSFLFGFACGGVTLVLVVVMLIYRLLGHLEEKSAAFTTRLEVHKSVPEVDLSSLKVIGVSGTNCVGLMIEIGATLLREAATLGRQRKWVSQGHEVDLRGPEGQQHLLFRY